MGLLDAPATLLRAFGAGVGAFFNELQGGDAQSAPPAAAAAPAPPAAAPQAAEPSPQGPGRQPHQQPDAPAKDLDDVTITRKVETEIFRGADRHELKAHIDVNAVDGVVYLRGVAKTPDLINALEAETQAIPEVKGVENLLHLPHTPAPTRSDTPAPQRKTRRSPSKGPRTEPRRLNADKSSSETADAPETLAKQRKGRQPAPMGSDPEGKDTNAPAPEDFTGRFRRGADEDPIAGERPGTEQPATSTLATEGGPEGGGGEVVH